MYTVSVQYYKYGMNKFSVEQTHPWTFEKLQASSKPNQMESFLKLIV